MMLTVTGVDKYTKLDNLCGSHDLEYGVLYSAKQGEVRNRYPHFAAIEKIVCAVINPALHVCGAGARTALLGGEERVAALVTKCKRVQVNGIVSLAELTWLLELYPETIFITQHTPENQDLCSYGLLRHQVLVDASGGRGITSDWYTPTNTKVPVGYAGGLSPDNLAYQLEALYPLLQPGWWVDMETGVRDNNDEFSIEKAAEVRSIFCSFKGGP